MLKGYSSVMKKESHSLGRERGFIFYLEEVETGVFSAPVRSAKVNGFSVKNKYPTTNAQLIQAPAGMTPKACKSSNPLCRTLLATTMSAIPL
jgi:hypothetical protein